MSACPLDRTPWLSFHVCDIIGNSLVHTLQNVWITIFFIYMSFHKKCACSCYFEW